MHFSTRNFLSLAGLAAIVAISAAQASAQTAIFTLPFTAHVGNATLPPGEYRLQVTGTASPIPSAFVYHDNKLVTSVAALRQVTPDADGSYVELRTIGVSRYFYKFVSSDTGAIYTFGIPRAAQHQVLADARATRVPASSRTSN